MPTFVSTIKFTDKGIANIRNTAERVKAFKSEAEKMGVQVTDIFWTLGAFDGLVVYDAPDEETAAALMLHLGSHNAVKTHTCRAFREPEMTSILSKLQ